LSLGGKLHAYHRKPSAGSSRTNYLTVRGMKADIEYYEEIDCGWCVVLLCWSLLSYGGAEMKRLNLGNLNPIYERVLNKLDVHQRGGMCL